MALAGCASSAPTEAPQPPRVPQHAPEIPPPHPSATIDLERVVEATTEIPVATATPVVMEVIQKPVAQGVLYDTITQYFPTRYEKAYRVMMCESRGRPDVVSPNGMYHGLWQFDVVTWNGVGGEGLPSDASPDEQTMRARMLFDLRGWQPWPVCGQR